VNIEIISLIKKVSFKVWITSSCIGGICLFKFGVIDAIKIVNTHWIIQCKIQSI